MFFVAAAASFNGFYEKWHFREAGTSAYMPGASLEEMLDGTAARPYVHRQMIPALANAIDSLIPASMHDCLFDFRLYSGRLFRDDFIDSPMARNRTWFLRYWIVHSAVFLSAFVSTVAMYLVAKTAGYQPTAAALAAVAMILVMPYFMTRGGFFYDYPELAFLAIAVLMATRFDWLWLLPIAALAAWNKESFLFFVPTLYPLLRTRTSRLRASIGIAALVFTCAIVDRLISLRLQHNPGGAIEWHLLDQLNYLAHPLNMLLREKTYGLLMIQAFNPLLWALIALIAINGWRSLSRPIQRHAQIAALINIPLYLLFCLPGELRDLSMLYPTLLLLLAANFNDWNLTPATTQRPEPTPSSLVR